MSLLWGMITLLIAASLRATTPKHETNDVRRKPGTGLVSPILKKEEIIYVALILPSEFGQSSNGSKLYTDTCVRPPPMIINGTITTEKRPCLATLELIVPAVRIAAEHARKRRPKTPRIQFLPLKAECRDQKQTVAQFLWAKDNYNIKAVFGPVCDYGVSALTRVTGYYNVSVLTPGALSHSFADKQEFLFLTRLGQGLFEELSKVVISLKTNFNWRQLVYVYQLESFFETEVLSQEFCRLFGNTINEDLKPNVYFKQLQDKKLQSWLVNEIGNKLSG